MDHKKIRSFVQDLTYDLNTIQYLLDYGRVKETLPIVEKILDTIDAIKTRPSDDKFKNTFSEDFWNKRLPPGTSFQAMRTNISHYAHSKSPEIEKDLDKINYWSFVKNIFNWADDNMPGLQHAAKSPSYQKLEKSTLWVAGTITVISLLIFFNQQHQTRYWGLKGDFYKGINFDQHLFTGSKKTINFSTPEDMDSRLPHDYFSARWKGSLLAPQDSKYTFFATSDDAVKVFIDGKILISDWIHHPKRESMGEIFLSKGSHQIDIEYFQSIGHAVLQLSWAFENQEKEIIPAKYLRH